jgi:hypothetical protein
LFKFQILGFIGHFGHAHARMEMAFGILLASANNICIVLRMVAGECKIPFG